MRIRWSEKYFIFRFYDDLPEEANLEGTRRRFESTGLHTNTKCGTDVCLASPSVDRATTEQRRNLECTNEVADDRERFY